jgi:hypothetical protein
MIPSLGVRVNRLCQMIKKRDKSEARNPKWFDKPIDRLTVLSRVEGLTTLSPVARQYLMTKIQILQTESVLEVANLPLFLTFGHLIFEFVSPNFIRWARFVFRIL